MCRSWVTMGAGGIVGGEIRCSGVCRVLGLISLPACFWTVYLVRSKGWAAWKNCDLLDQGAVDVSNRSQDCWVDMGGIDPHILDMVAILIERSELLWIQKVQSISYGRNTCKS